MTAASIATRSRPQSTRGTIGGQYPVRAYGAHAAIASNSLPNFLGFAAASRELCCHEPGIILILPRNVATRGRYSYRHHKLQRVPHTIAAQYSLMGE
jgi:hypothetical protein